MNNLLGAMLFFAGLAFAETGEFEISGMKCQSCVKNLKNKVCALEGIESCEIDVGKMKLTTKQGSKLDIEKIKKAVNFNGNYNIEKLTLNE